MHVLQGVPLVHVAMDQRRSLVVVRGEAPFGGGKGVGDDALVARSVELLPHALDERYEPAALLRPRWQRSVAGVTSHPA